MPPKSIKVHARVLDKTVVVSCGAGMQRLKWLGNVAISRWDEDTMQGWRTLGEPVKIINSEGEELDMGLTIRDILEDGTEITVVPTVDDKDVVARSPSALTQSSPCPSSWNCINSEGGELDTGLAIRDILEDGTEITVVPTVDDKDVVAR
ncbi:hypothetical protein TeGR_g13590 [Tetraparma gracilis]|uniref:Par3/HAL N-terminal domain-containing protein n=1 Tax=Tetraparma gracilis TaxID=2962635 RepID=A0ABQ6MY42_9STRA|nr:hypothetical protein TeGR_g13590 [Tetraparma gracilis]